MKKLISLVLICVLLCGTMTSCDMPEDMDGLLDMAKDVFDSVAEGVTDILDDLFNDDEPAGPSGPDGPINPGGSGEGGSGESGDTTTPGGSQGGEQGGTTTPGGSQGGEQGGTTTPGGSQDGEQGGTTTPGGSQDGEQGKPDNPGGSDNPGNPSSPVIPPSGVDQESYVEKGDSPTLGGQSAKELYDRANATLLQFAKNYESTTTTTVTMTMAGNPNVMTMNMQMYSHERDGHVHCRVTGHPDLVADLAQEAWYADGMLYQITRDGKKLKVAMSMQDYLDKYYNVGEGERTLMNVPESWFADMGFITTENGAYLRMVMRGQEMLDALKRIGKDAVDGVVIDKVYYDVHFDASGKLTHVETTYDTYFVSYPGLVTKTQSTTVYTRLGNADPITAPSNASEFIQGYLK